MKTNKKNTIKLTESELKNIILESVKKIIKEDCDNIESQCGRINENDEHIPNDQRCYQLAEDLLEVIEPISLIAKLGERMGFFALRKYLESIARIELSDNYGQDEEEL